MMNIKKEIQIGNRILSPTTPCFIIAEAGVNHNGNLDLAKKLIDVAAESGADCVKFQTFKAHKLNTKKAPKSSYHLKSTPKDDEQSWFDLLRSQEISHQMHLDLIKHCQERKILFLSTPYDSESADLLHELGIAAFKIASTDANNIPLLRHIARKNRPIILSTAMCTMSEVRESVEAIYNEGNSQLILLHCTANYPADIANTNLRAMKSLEREFDCIVGYSDHCLSYHNPIAAVALGAKVIEKHFTLSRHLPGPDHQASLTPERLKDMIEDVRLVERSLGTGEKKPLGCEEENLKKLRKSVVSAVSLKNGTTLTLDHLEIKRPGTGMEPKRIYDLVGKKITCDLPEDHIFSDADFE